MPDYFSNSRRTFLKTTAAATLIAPLGYAQEEKKSGANDNIQIAVIGIGGQGTSDLNTALQVPGVKMVAAADVYDGRLARAKESYGQDVFTSRDYREVLARKEVDAVIIATPDHWHSKIAVDAMEAGKDVYCEKPMVQKISQGKSVIEAQKRTGRIIQVGSQRVSSIVYLKAKELIRSGAIGELNMIEGWLDRNSAIGAWQYSIPPDASPQTIDWDRFLDGAPKRPFEPIRLFRWRNYRDYGTGIPGDLFVHQFSGIHVVTGALGPLRVQASGALRYWKDGRDVPDIMFGLYDYPDFNINLRVNFESGAAGTAEGSGFRFIGTEGVLQLGSAGITVTRSPRPKEPGYTINTFPKAVQQQFLADYRQKYPGQPDQIRSEQEERYSPPRNYNEHLDHFRNFFEAVRTRKPVVEDAVFGFRAAGPALLTNDAFFENKIIHWDPEKMELRQQAEGGRQ